MLHRIPQLLLVLLSVLVCLPSVAQQAQEEKIERLCQEAMNHYDMLELESSEAKLFEAIAIAQRSGIEKPAVAQCHIMLGLVYLATGDEESTRDEFRQALEIDPKCEIDPLYSTPSKTDLFNEVASSITPPEIETLETKEPETGMVRHSPIEYADAFQPVDFRIFIPTDMKVSKVYLYIRPYGEANFYINEMFRLDSQTWMYTLGGDQVTRNLIDYYIEVNSVDGTVTSGVGTDFAPLQITVFGAPDNGKPPVVGPDDPNTKTFRRVTIFAGVGSGIGLATGKPINWNVGKPEASQVVIKKGIATSPFHMKAEINIHVTKLFSICGFGRIQFFDRVEPIFGGKLRFFILDESPLLLYLGAGGGYGYVSHTVNLAPVEDFTDVTIEGPGHAGLDVGITIDLAPHFSVTIGVYIMALFGDAFSVQGDLNVGLSTYF